MLQQLRRRLVQQRLHMSPQRFVKRPGRRVIVRAGASLRLRHDLLHHAHPDDLARGQLQLLRSLDLARVAAPPASAEAPESLEFSSRFTRSATPMPSAPPLPPSPMTAATIGTGIRNHSMIARAMAAAIPRSSAPAPGYAPGVSIRETIGHLNLEACLARRMGL